MTQLLADWSQGDGAALTKLTPLVYEDLRRLAHHHMGGQRPDHTLQTTALVNEAYLRLADQTNPRWQDRAHFFAVAARAMRQILVNYAKSYRTQKRGGGALKVELDEAALVSPEQSKEIVDLHEALERLATVDPEKLSGRAKIFGGLNYDEMAEVLKISPVTVRRDWKFAKAVAIHGIAQRDLNELESRLPSDEWVEYDAGAITSIEEIFHAALDQEPDQISAFLERPAKAMSFCAAESKRSWLRISEQAASLKRQRLVSRRRLSKIGKVICSSVTRSATTKFLNGSALAGWAKSISPQTLRRAARPHSNSCPRALLANAERLKRFQQEARAVVGLNHPNIVTVYEIGEDHSTHYIASELIEGETLRQRLARGPMRTDEAVDVAIQVASALAAAHEAGIVHRDIKPENIMLRPDGYVKVLDFGIAKLAEQEVPVTMPEKKRCCSLRPTWDQSWEPFVTCRRNRRAAHQLISGPISGVSA